MGFQIGHSNTLPVSLFRSTQAGPNLGVGGKALCLDQNQRWPVRLSLSRMQYLLLCTVQHLPVLEIGMLWCVSLSDTCSEEVTLKRVKKTLVSTQDPLLCVMSRASGLTVWTVQLVQLQCWIQSDWNCHQSRSVKEVTSKYVHDTTGIEMEFTSQFSATFTALLGGAYLDGSGGCSSCEMLGSQCLYTVLIHHHCRGRNRLTLKFSQWNKDIAFFPGLFERP